MLSPKAHPDLVGLFPPRTLSLSHRQNVRERRCGNRRSYAMGGYRFYRILVGSGVWLKLT